MAKIRFPWHVKVEGNYYAPGEIIEVSDASQYLSEGAEILPEDEPKAEPDETNGARSRRGRRKQD